MSFETELRERMRTGVQGLEVDLGALTAGGTAVGARRKRRRLAVQVVAASATVAVLGGVAVSYAGRPVSDPQPPVATATTTVAATTQITPQAALRILRELLPPGSRTSGYQGGTGRGETWTSLTYDGRDHLTLVLGKTLPPTTCSPPRQDERCSRTRLADGSALTTIRISNHGREIAWQVAIDRPDGVHVVLTQDYEHEVRGNGVPPLPIAAMRTVVTSSRWQLRVDKAFAAAAEPLFVPRRPAPVSTPPVVTTTPTPR